MYDMTKTQLIAIAGLSGSGKSVLAKNVLDVLNQHHETVYLRGDVIRKALAKVTDTTRLGDEYYTPAWNQKVYGEMLGQARLTLRQGKSVIIDSTFLDEKKRFQVETLVKEIEGVPFRGLWLDVNADTLRKRVSHREKMGTDASDAGLSILERQLKKQALISLNPAWEKVDANGTMDDTKENALALFSIPSLSYHM